METKDIPIHGPSDWRREPSEQTNAILGKLGEEASELSARCFRSMIQGLDSIDPDSKKSNREHLEEEIADVIAQIDMATVFLKLNIQAINDRSDKKFAYKLPWIKALPNNS